MNHDPKGSENSIGNIYFCTGKPDTLLDMSSSNKKHGVNDRHFHVNGVYTRHPSPNHIQPWNKSSRRPASNILTKVANTTYLDGLIKTYQTQYIRTLANSRRGESMIRRNVSKSEQPPNIGLKDKLLRTAEDAVLQPRFRSVGHVLCRRKPTDANAESLPLSPYCFVRSESANHQQSSIHFPENSIQSNSVRPNLFNGNSASLAIRESSDKRPGRLRRTKKLECMSPIVQRVRSGEFIPNGRKSVSSAIPEYKSSLLDSLHPKSIHSNLVQRSNFHKFLVRPLVTHTNTKHEMPEESLQVDAGGASGGNSYKSLKEQLQKVRKDLIEKSLLYSDSSDQCLTSFRQSNKNDPFSNVRVLTTLPIYYTLSVIDPKVEQIPILRRPLNSFMVLPKYAKLTETHHALHKLITLDLCEEIRLPTTTEIGMNMPLVETELNLVYSAGLIKTHYSAVLYQVLKGKKILPKEARKYSQQDKQLEQNQDGVGIDHNLKISSPSKLVKLDSVSGTDNDEALDELSRKVERPGEQLDVAESKSDVTSSVRSDVTLFENYEYQMNEEAIASTSDASYSDSMQELSDGELLTVNKLLQHSPPTVDDIIQSTAKSVPLNEPHMRIFTSSSSSKSPCTPAYGSRLRKVNDQSVTPANKASVSPELPSGVSANVTRAHTVPPSRPQGDTSDDGVMPYQLDKTSDVERKDGATKSTARCFTGNQSVEHRDLTIEKSSELHVLGDTTCMSKIDATECSTVEATLSQKPGTQNESGISCKELMQQRRRAAVEKEDKGATKTIHPALIASLFPNVPPVLRFVEEGHKLTSTSEDLETIESSDWIFYFGKHMRPQVFRSIREYQKVNHLPCSFQLGRKDRLWRNVFHMQNRCGRENFSFMPETFCLPGDLEALKKAWDEDGADQRWILKPPASARGIGVRLITKWAQVPKKRQAIVQRYLGRPFLINDSKFDLRIYVYISSINPLRVYIHEEGLVRFASQKYSNSLRCLGNRFVHLTNYSINRLNSEYVSNSNDQLAKGHKWSLRALWAYFKAQGISPTPIWSSIKDVVVKTAISTEAAFNAAINSYCNHSCSVHEVFGFDIFLDENLQPWLLEVNVSPSMHSDSPLDAKVKGTVVKDMLNLCGLRLPEFSEVNCNTVVPTCLAKVRHPEPSESHFTSIFPSLLHFHSPNISNAPITSPFGSSGSLNEEATTTDRKVNSCGNQECYMPQCLQKPKGPSHEWLMDRRLHITQLSEDEKEKRRYYVMRATRYELPRAPSRCHSRVSSNGSVRERSASAGTNNRQKSAIRPKSGPNKSSAFYVDEDGDQDGSVSTVSSSSGKLSGVSSVRSVGGWQHRNSKEEVNNSSNRTARSMGIGPSSPDLKSHRFQPGSNLVNPKPPVVTREKLTHKTTSGNTILRSSSSSSQGRTKVRSSTSRCGSESQTPTRMQGTLPRVRLSVATADILTTLTPSDVRILTAMVDELERAGGFQCIFPPSSAGLAVRYLSYFEAPRYANLLCVAYIQKYGQDKEEGVKMLKLLCEKNLHLMSGAFGDRVQPEHIWRKPAINIPTTPSDSTNSPKSTPLIRRPSYSKRTVV
ncbi:unnamed protein product [Dicrocoelium dendriticum]|nr:unnamed protein product [Dicrocoelium dendriticum]